LLFVSEGHCSTGQSPQWAVVPLDEEEEELFIYLGIYLFSINDVGYIMPS